MPPRRGDEHGALDGFLSEYGHEILHARLGLDVVDLDLTQHLVSIDPPHHFRKRMNRQHGCLLDDRGLDPVAFGNEHRLHPTSISQQNHGGGSTDTSHAAIKRQFTGHQYLVDPDRTAGLYRSTCHQDRDRDRQVVHRPFFSEIGRCQIDGQMTIGPLIPTVENGCPDSFDRFPDGRIRQSDDRRS